MRRIALAIAALSVIVCTTPSRAADLNIAFESSSTSIDPHFYTLPKNFMINNHVFETLVRRDNETSAPQPWLATSWKLLDDKTWEFKLRPNVKWHDGSPFTAEDVIFTVDRIRKGVPNAPTPFTAYIKFIEKMEATDPLTLKISTNSVAPGLLLDLSYILIVSKKHGESAATGDYNTGKAAIGTGPYKFVSYSPNDTTIVTKNQDYWGEKEPWDNVKFRIISQAGPRTSALLAGDVDVIESVPSADLERLKANPNITIWGKPSSRVGLILLDITKEATSGNNITDLDDKPLSENPLSDKRVRHALLHAIDFNAFVNRVMEGQAVATGQYFNVGYTGYNPDIKIWEYNIEKSRALLKEAGWENKFKMKLITYPGAFQNSDQVAGALAQAWTRIGVKTDVINMPYAVLSQERLAHRAALSLNSFANSAPSGDSTFVLFLHTKEKSFGTFNAGGYSNKELDRLVEDSIPLMEESKRDELLRKATKLAVDDAAIIPLWLFYENTGTKKNLTFIPRADRFIYAMNVRPAK